MNKVLNFERAFETKRSNLEANKGRWSIEMGSVAIDHCDIETNDPIIHLCDYIRKKDEALAGIKEDFITTLSERYKDKNAYILNKLQFTFNETDFTSINDNVSMRSMTKNNLETMKRVLAGSPSYFMEISRAKAEIEEVDKLVDWFKDAPTGANLVFESPPISENEEYAFTRIYHKLSDNVVEGGFFSLRNPSVDQFNNLRRVFNADASNKDEIDILRNCYQINNPTIKNTDDAIKAYVGVYDQLLSDKNSRSYSFGIETNGSETYDGLSKVRRLPELTDIYVDTLDIIKNSNGIVTLELLKINNDFETNDKFILGQKLTIPIIREQLNSVIMSVASTIDKADEAMIVELSEKSGNRQAYRDIASHFGDVARANGEKYVSVGCPEFTKGNPAGESAELSDNDIFTMSHGSSQILKNFGERGYKVCRTPNCPSHGEVSWLPNKTLVGGCCVCVGCHLLYQKGKDPKYEYKTQKQEKTAETNKAKIIRNKKTKKISQLKSLQDKYKQDAENGDIVSINKYKEINTKIKRLNE